MLTNPRQFLLALFVASAIFFVLDQLEPFSVIASSGRERLIKPTINVGNTLIVNSIDAIEPIFHLRFFIQDYKKIQNELEYYRSEYFKLLGVSQENEFLRRSLKLEERAQEAELILAEITSFDPIRPNQAFTLNKGGSNGIAVGQAVILENNILLGQISEVSSESSKVVMITAEGSNVLSTLESVSINAIIRGSPSGALSLELIPSDKELQEGEIVITSGLGGAIPSNLLIGTIRRVIRDETASFQRAVVEPFFNARELRRVFVINKVK